MWIARRSNQLILKEISPEYSLEGLMLKVKLLYFGHLMWRADSVEKTLMLGKIEGKEEKGIDRGWDGSMASLTQWTLSLSRLWEIVKDREAQSAAVHGVTRNQTQLSKWTTTSQDFIIKSWWEALTVLCYKMISWQIRDKQPNKALLMKGKPKKRSHVIGPESRLLEYFL